MTITLQHGDCLALMPQIPAHSIDMILCDLPYAVTRASWDSLIPFDKLWAQYKRLIKPSGVIALTSCQPFTAALTMSNPTWFRYELIWEKPQGVDFMNAKRKPLRSHENILIFSPIGQHTYNPQFEAGEPYTVTRDRKPRHMAITDKTMRQTETVNTGNRYPKSVLRFAQQRGLHPTQKPVSLCEWLIKTYSNAGETILDNCMGSGTTGLAALNCGRRFIGIEKDANYFELASRRLAMAQERAA